ncbi:MAG: GNAT family N-acetyltransferase [Symbiobacterium sp.]|uniref:N-acetyltransferase family protein n=1 Tax=Symbiobacterium sp. TaxID=1971213 RepID=UPI003463ACDD
MVRVRAYRPAELPLVLARGVASARDQLVGRERPHACGGALERQFHEMYRLVLSVPDSALLVAELAGPPPPGAPDGALAGHVLLLPQGNPFTGAPEVVVMDIWVHPALRGRGIGTRLLAAAEAHARRIGARGLVAQIALHNGASLALFRRSGFVQERVVVGKGW